MHNLKVDAFVFNVDWTDDGKEEQRNLNEKLRMNILFRRLDISIEVVEEVKNVDKLIADYCVNRFDYFSCKAKKRSIFLYSCIKILEARAQDKFDVFHYERTQLKALTMRDLVQADWAQIGSNPSSDDIEMLLVRNPIFQQHF